MIIGETLSVSFSFTVSVIISAQCAFLRQIGRIFRQFTEIRYFALTDGAFSCMINTARIQI